MRDVEKYPLFMGTEVTCKILGLDPEEALRHAGFSEIEITSQTDGVTAVKYFDAWNAMEDMSKRDDLVAFLGRAIANGPIIPAFFALSCAPNLREGLLRLSRYKSLIGPTKQVVVERNDKFCVEYISTETDVDVPPSLASLHVVFLVEKARGLMAYPLKPETVFLPLDASTRSSIEAFFGVMPERGPIAKVVFSDEDARRPFISENQSLWEDFERDLERQLDSRRTSSSYSSLVRDTLFELLPTGRASGDSVCASIGVSRSTLQRRLSEEGSSFQEVLDNTRKQIAIRYLQKSTLTIDEISHALSFRDKNSFFRAFRKWTGSTPAKFREEVSQS